MWEISLLRIWICFGYARFGRKITNVSIYPELTHETQNYSSAEQRKIFFKEFSFRFSQFSSRKRSLNQQKQMTNIRKHLIYFLFKK